MRTSLTLLVAVVGSWVGSPPAAAAPPTPAASVSLGDGGVVVSRETRPTVYLMDPKDGIVAVDLVTNKRKWAARALAAKPLALVGRALIGADEKGEIRVLDARTGKRFPKCDKIPGLTIQLFDGLGSNQSSFGTSDGKRAWISWSYDSHYAGGAAPTDEMEAQSRRHGGGTYEIDVATCTGKAGLDPTSPRPVPSSSDAEYTSPLGTAFRVTAGELRLERVRAGKPLPPIELKQALPNATMFAVTADRRHVIVGDYVGNAYPSVIVDVETGAVIAKPTLPLFPPGSVLVGRRLVIGGGAIWVFDLDKRKVVWSRGLRSTAYNGPYPPSAPPGRP